MSLGPSDHFLWGKWLSPGGGHCPTSQHSSTRLSIPNSDSSSSVQLHSSTFPPPQADVVCTWVLEGNRLCGRGKENPIVEVWTQRCGQEARGEGDFSPLKSSFSFKKGAPYVAQARLKHTT